ncbi:hypothetical protein [Streptomyces cinereospinus]|uniref:SPOR domain-containing protein n=1 Tax=Streptomyces cinereospinus TaxID=285561 RepID=A0ABV5N670_9ACTN
MHEVSGGQSRVRWSGVFTPAGTSDEEAVALLRGIHAAGPAARKKTLDG